MKEFTIFFSEVFKAHSIEENTNIVALKKLNVSKETEGVEIKCVFLKFFINNKSSQSPRCEKSKFCNHFLIKI